MTNPDITSAGIAKALGKLAGRAWQATYDPADHGWWNVSAPWECEGTGGMDTIDESGDGGFEKETAEAIAYALTALPLIAERMESLEYQVGELTQYNERAEARVAELEAENKRIAFEAENTQADLQAQIATLTEILEGR